MDFKLQTCDEIPELTPEARTAVESAYRRGFVQGAYSALRAMNAGKSPSCIERWVTRLHIDWRCKKHNGRFTPPTELV